MFILAGIGNNIDEIPIGVIKWIKKADFVFLESYTNFLDKNSLKFLKKIRNDIKIVDRKFVEEKLEKLILKNPNKKILLLVSGSPLFATTHISLIVFCKVNNISYKILNAPSIFDEIGKIGISLYKFGRIISIPFHESESFFMDLINNIRNNLHTLILLDIDPKNDKYVSVKEALERILKLEDKYKTGLIDVNKEIIVCSNLGRKNEKVLIGKISDFLNLDLDPPICIIFPANLNEIEKENIYNLFKVYK